MIFSFLLVQTAAANLVDNGGFETGDFTGWVVFEATEGSKIFVENWGAPWYGSHSGSYGAAFGALITSDDTIRQDIGTTAGQKYTFSFWLKHYVDSVDNDFHASWSGTQLLNMDPAGYFDWTMYTFTVTALGSTSTIEFSGREPMSYFALDDVNVSQVPLPGTLMLLGSGFLGLGAWGYGRRKIT